MPSRHRLQTVARPLPLAALLLALAGCGGGSSGTPSQTGAAAGSTGPGDVPALSLPGTGSGTGTGTDGQPATGAGGGSGTAAAGVTTSAGPGCTLQYTLTGSPLIAGADPLLGQQWHLRNTGQAGGTPGQDLNAFDAWQVTRGAGARVAVIDVAIEVSHPDLLPNLVAGASRSYRPNNPDAAWPLPCTSDEDHGTAVAGLAVARDDDSIGGAGVAPRASLVAFDALTPGLDVDIADALTRDGALNQIYHNSWGSPDDGALHAADAAFASAVEQGIAGGRGGLGSVYVFSAGNGGCYARRGTPATCMDDDANYDGYVNRRGVIAVCAVDDRGQRPGYGEPGANVTVCAPSSGSRSGITTTALRGAYRGDFSGTSASAPMVSGTVALMLAANPQLSWRDVRLILARTARQNDPSDGGWETSALPSLRAGVTAQRFNHKYGYGVVDAGAAVRAAQGWSTVGGSASMLSCGPYVRATPRALPDASARNVGTPVADTVSVAGCPITRIEWVELRLTAPHAYSGDLRVRLASPAGTVSRLADLRACAGGCGSYANWSFGSIRHLDEGSNGAWTLELTDLDPIDTGSLQGWSLILHGR